LGRLGQAGVAVPADLAVVGYDDIEFAADAAVPLTSVRQPKYQLGRAAAELLLDEADRPDQHQHRRFVFQPELVAPPSTRPAPAAARSPPSGDPPATRSPRPSPPDQAQRCDPLALLRSRKILVTGDSGPRPGLAPRIRHGCPIHVAGTT